LRQYVPFVDLYKSRRALLIGSAVDVLRVDGVVDGEIVGISDNDDDPRVLADGADVDNDSSEGLAVGGKLF